MAGKGSKPGERRGGRQKGTPNKVSKTVKENFIHAFDSIGGAEKMSDWAEENQTEFYRLYARLVPTELNATLDATVKTHEELLSELDNK